MNERIAERIGKDLVDLIPADQWQEMVDREVAKFRLETGPKIIQELLREAYTVKAKEVIGALTSDATWDQESGQYVSEELERFIGKSSGAIMGAMLAPAMSQVLPNLRNQLGY